MTVPTATVNRVVDQLLAKGRVARGFLGVALQPVQLPKSGSPSSRGLLVILVEPAGPAEKAGLMVGDVVIAVGDKPLTDSTELQRRSIQSMSVRRFSCESCAAAKRTT